MKRLLRIVTTVLTLMTAGMTAGPLCAAEFSPAQRAEIVTIIRDAMKQDPSILRDAITALQADEGEEEGRHEPTRRLVPAVRGRRGGAQAGSDRAGERQ